MSRNGNGTYNLPAGNPVVTGTTISSTWANTTLTDIATALTNSVAADGQTPITGSLIGTSGTVTFGGVGQTRIPSGTTAQRSASPQDGMIRFNTDLQQYEGYRNGSWSIFGNGAGGTLFSDTVTATQGQTLFNLPTGYVQGGDNLSVYVNGSRQIYNVNYTETSTSSFTFATGLNAGDLVNYTIGASTSLSVNAASVLYNEGSVDAVNRNAEQKFQEIVSVKDFGAVGDGVTNDTVAIENAIDYCLTTNHALYVPSGVYRHNEITITPAVRASLRIVGNTSYDFTPLTSGSIFQSLDNSGSSFVINGNGPFYMAMEGITFYGNLNLDAGIKTVARTNFSVKRCCFANYSTGSGIELTLGAGTFNGAILVEDCRFSFCGNGIKITDEEPNNVFNIINNVFIDCGYGFIAGTTANPVETRNVNIWRNAFENCTNTEMYVEGTIKDWAIIGNYIEKVTTTPIIYIKQALVGFSGGCHISDNLFQAPLTTDQAMIYVDNIKGLKVENNYCTSGNSIDRYFVYFGTNVTDSYVEKPSTPNGITMFPIYNLRTLTKTYRSTYSDENIAISTNATTGIQLNGTGDAVGSNTTTVNLAVYTARQGIITVEFDLTLATKSGTASGFAEIINLPITNAGNPAAVVFYQATNIASAYPLSGVIDTNTNFIKIFANTGARIDFPSQFVVGTRVKGTVTYTTA